MWEHLMALPKMKLITIMLAYKLVYKLYLFITKHNVKPDFFGSRTKFDCRAMNFTANIFVQVSCF